MAVRSDGTELQKLNLDALLPHNLQKPDVYVHCQVVQVALEFGVME